MTKGCGLDGSHRTADLLDSIHTVQHLLLQKILVALNVGTEAQPDPTVRVEALGFRFEPDLWKGSQGLRLMMQGLARKGWKVCLSVFAAHVGTVVPMGMYVRMLGVSVGKCTWIYVREVLGQKGTCLAVWTS